MRARGEARTARFLNSKLRTIGIDKAGLDKQVGEKKKAKQLEKESNLEEGELHTGVCAFFNNI